MTNRFNFVKQCHRVSERPILKQRCTSSSNQSAARRAQTNGCCWHAVKGTELDSGEISVAHLQVISESVHASLTATVLIAARWSHGSRLQCKCAKQTFNAALELWDEKINCDHLVLNSGTYDISDVVKLSLSKESDQMYSLFILAGR